MLVYVKHPYTCRPNTQVFVQIQCYKTTSNKSAISKAGGHVRLTDVWTVDLHDWCDHVRQVSKWMWMCMCVWMCVCVCVCVCVQVHMGTYTHVCTICLFIVCDIQCPLWSTHAGKTSHRQTTASIQRCMQEGPKSLEHRPEQLGSNSPQMVSLETDCVERSLQLQRDARSAAQGKENEKKGCSPCRQASIKFCLCPLPQGLSFPHQTG